MKTDPIKYDWPVLITTCMAVGGIFTVLFLCVFVGFGLNSLVGKEALYVCLSLNAVNVVALLLRRRQLPRKAHASRLLRLLDALALPVWCAGTAALLFALVAGLCGAQFGSASVYYPCLIGTILVPIGWLGILIHHCTTQPKAA